MKPEAAIQLLEKLELKLELLTSEPSSLPERLGRIPAFRRRKTLHQKIFDVYHDTPESLLHYNGVSLRLRRVASESQSRWVQILQTAGRGDLALNLLREWEAPVPGSALILKPLKATPWIGIDPDGCVFQALESCFVAIFERSSWWVRRRDGSAVLLALDIGQITSGAQRAAICKLKLQLNAGQPTALFNIAQQIASTIAMVPVNMSTSDCGHALAQNRLDMPLRAQPPELTPDLGLAGAAQLVLREVFRQFTINLNALRTSDDPELVHQTRIGWRRFRAAACLFRPTPVVDAMPSWQALKPLLTALSELRDLDVARTETLPPLVDAYAAADSRRAQEWHAMTLALTHAANLSRTAVRCALQEPMVGATLLAIMHWIEDLSSIKGAGDAVLKPWSRRRISRLHERLKRALKTPDTPENLHRSRILAKRMRYGIEALRVLLPRRRSQRWYQQATDLQTGIGATRDIAQAATLVAKLGLARGLVEFLRGFGAGSNRPSRSPMGP